MSEVEINLLKNRMLEGAKNKAKRGEDKEIISTVLLVVLFCFSVLSYADARDGSKPSDVAYQNVAYQNIGQNTYAAVAKNDLADTVAENDATSGMPSQSNNGHPQKLPPLKPYPRLLPLELIAPQTAQADIPLNQVKVILRNPGDSAPNASLRLIIHEKNHNHSEGHLNLSPGNVKLEVLEGTSWMPVMLDMVDKSVLGVIGVEGSHTEHHKRGGFTIPAGFNKSWQLRVTFSLPGTYQLIVALSPDNGSRHLSRPAHSTIVVQ